MCLVITTHDCLVSLPYATVPGASTQLTHCAGLEVLVLGGVQGVQDTGRPPGDKTQRIIYTRPLIIIVFNIIETESFAIGDK